MYSVHLDGAFCICCALFTTERSQKGALVNLPFRKWHHKGSNESILSPNIMPHKIKTFLGFFFEMKVTKKIYFVWRWRGSYKNSNIYDYFSSSNTVIIMVSDVLRLHSFASLISKFSRWSMPPECVSPIKNVSHQSRIGGYIRHCIHPPLGDIGSNVGLQVTSAGISDWMFAYTRRDLQLKRRSRVLCVTVYGPMQY